MEKLIITYSYWLGILSALLALLTRGLNILGLVVAGIGTRGNAIGYRTFLDGSTLFFLTAIATASYVWFKSQKAQV